MFAKIGKNAMSRPNPNHPSLTLSQRLNQISAYQWILLSQLLIVAFHVKNLPIWLSVYAFFIILFQLQPLRRWLPNSLYRQRSLQLIQYTGFIASLVGLYLTYHTAFGLDVGIAFLLLCAVSKLLELHTRRDGYVVLSLSLFVLAGLFLINQDLITTLQVAIGTMVVLFAMIAQNDDGTGRYRTLGLLVGQAIPLTIILFLFFPRLPPLWSVHLSGAQAKTGMSDSMSPGDFANLSQSTELAFRVEFGNQQPSQQNLYWRGLVFSDFDGTTWRANPRTSLWTPDQPIADWLLPTLKLSKRFTLAVNPDYRVILEQTGQNWLFGLDYPITNQRGIGLTSDFTLRYWDTVNQRFTYQVHWLDDAPINLALSTQQRQVNLALPAGGNPQSRQFAQRLYRQAGDDPIAYTNAIAQWMRSQQFRYTLSPPTLGSNRIDDFLFATRAGFCEHYASSFTYLMRAAGVPARVVAGYQGGQLGRDGKSWEVRQMDAHAWSEIWVQGRGWVRVDPTGFIAPNRVEQGMDTVTQTAGAKMFGEGVAGQISYQQFQMLQQARRLFDQASYYWQRDVVGYDQDRQRSSLFKWLNIQSVYQQVMVMFVTLVSVLALFGLWLWWRRRRVWDKHDWIMVQLSNRLAKKDKTLARQDSEGVLAWLARLEPNVTDKAALQALAALYRQIRYQQPRDNKQPMRQLDNLAKTIALKKH
jgi:transglutaminase-like putative cysteine protease